MTATGSYKYCDNCGAANRQNASFCVKCGQQFSATAAPQQQQQAPQQPQQQYQPQQGMQAPEVGVGNTQNLDDHMASARPDNYMTRSIISIILGVLCSGIITLVLGILAVIQANKVNSLYDAGDQAGALRASNKAKNLSLAGVISAAVIVVLIILVVIIMAAFEASSSSNYYY